MSELKHFGPEIWLSDGPVIKAALGFEYPTRMAVIRLKDGELFILSPVALTERLRAQLADLGTVRYVVAPNGLHDTYLAEWERAFPDAELHIAPGLAKKRPDLAVTTELCGEGPWMGEIAQVVVGGNAITSEVVFFHPLSGTVLFTDLLQQFPKGWHKGWRGLIARLDLMTESLPAVPRKFRVAFRDRNAAREALREILAWPVEKVVMAHGTPVTEDGAAFLRQAFAWLRED